MPFDPEENARKMRQNAAASAAQKRATSAGRTGNAKQKNKKQQHRWLKPAGVALLVLGAGVGVSHWLAHVGAFGAQPPGWVDLAAGYPMAGILLVVGGIAMGQR